jgi:plastocyanin
MDRESSDGNRSATAMGSRPPSTATRRAAVPALVALLLVGCGGGDAKPSAPRADAGSARTAVRVDIASFKFAPDAVTVRSGGRITWTNRDRAPHTATSDDDGRTFDTGTLRLGRSRTVTLTKPGTYSYHCEFHAFMTAKVVVR